MTRPASLCSAPNCPQLAPCALHQRRPWASNAGRSSTARGYGAAWRRQRDSILERDGYLCQLCFGETATDVDHIVPKSRGGTDAPDNLRALCAACHHRQTGREHGRRAGGVA